MTGVAPVFGLSLVAFGIGGLVLAVALHRWHEGHPSTVAPHRSLSGLPRAEIYNLSSVRLGGNAGGLLCALAAWLTLVNAFPGMGWFQLGSILAGVAVAVGVHAWRAAHPTSASIISIASR
jgi:hypothetical protein